MKIRHTKLFDTEILPAYGTPRELEFFVKKRDQFMQHLKIKKDRADTNMLQKGRPAHKAVIYGAQIHIKPHVLPTNAPMFPYARHDQTEITRYGFLTLRLNNIPILAAPLANIPDMVASDRHCPFISQRVRQQDKITAVLRWPFRLDLYLDTAIILALPGYYELPKYSRDKPD